MGGWDVIGFLHLVSAIAALAAGTILMLSRKGGTWHRRLGWAYVGSMAAVNLSALLIYELFGGFGPFHVAALVGIVTLSAGMVPALRRRPVRGWVDFHANFMVWSYIGLVAAGVSEVSTRYLDLPFGTTVIAATAVVILVGAALVRLRLPRTLKPFARHEVVS